MAIVATDVDYDAASAHAAAVVFDAWADASCRVELTMRSAIEAPYRPGAFFERELPCVLPLVRRAWADHGARIVVVDGYVDLVTKPGLGGHLHRALLDEGIDAVVLGVAKNPFPGAPAIEVHRGGSERPLYVSVRGAPPATAAAWIAGMHGRHRIPTLLRRVDQLARRIEPPRTA